MKKGFTLLELLIVITILSILAGAMLPLFQTSRLDAQRAKAMQELEALRKAALLLYQDTGYWQPRVYCGCGFVRDPTGSAGSSIPGWSGPYINEWRFDPWGRNYEVFDVNLGGVISRKIRSCGPDMTRGTPDDIIVTIAPDRSKGLLNSGNSVSYNDGELCHDTYGH